MTRISHLASVLMAMTGISPEAKGAIEDSARRLAAIGASQVNHKPGRKFEFPDHTVYQVGPNDAWRRLTGRRCENHNNMRNNGVRRRLAYLWEQ